jgi:hypothetical protein
MEAITHEGDGEMEARNSTMVTVAKDDNTGGWIVETGKWFFVARVKMDAEHLREHWWQSLRAKDEEIERLMVSKQNLVDGAAASLRKKDNKIKALEAACRAALPMLLDTHDVAVQIESALTM